MAKRRTGAGARRATNLRSLMNVGPAVERYLDGLGIRSIEQLANRDPDELFRSLSRRIGCACDPCLHDTFSAIVYEARMGTKTPWFTWTAARKRRVAAGDLQLGPAPVDADQLISSLIVSILWRGECGGRGMFGECAQRARTSIERANANANTASLFP
jgi:hypothetical protein